MRARPSMSSGGQTGSSSHVSPKGSSRRAIATASLAGQAQLTSSIRSTSAPIVSARLVEAVHKVLAQPAVQAQLVKQGVEPVASTPQELATYAAGEMKRW